MAKNTMYLYGNNSVLERLKANPKSIRQILLQENFNAPQITDIIKSKGLPVKYVTEKELTRIKNAHRLQGIVAVGERFQYRPFDELLKPTDKNLSLIFLDNINDPHNLGSIIRITACFGGFAIVIPEHSSCEINETVLHVASGGENFISISKGTGWLMELNTENGGQLKDTFDLDGDGIFTSADRIMAGGLPTGAVGIQPTTGGAMSSPIVLTSPPPSRPPAGGGCKEIKLAQATDGSVMKISETCRPGGREAWRQLK